MHSSSHLGEQFRQLPVGSTIVSTKAGSGHLGTSQYTDGLMRDGLANPQPLKTLTIDVMLDLYQSQAAAEPVVWSARCLLGTKIW